VSAINAGFFAGLGATDEMVFLTVKAVAPGIMGLIQEDMPEDILKVN
jgi:hypothetical protein